MLVENLCIVVKKNVFDSSSALTLFLILHQIPGSCSYKIVLIKQECMWEEGAHAPYAPPVSKSMLTWFLDLFVDLW